MTRAHWMIENSVSPINVTIMKYAFKADRRQTRFFDKETDGRQAVMI